METERPLEVESYFNNLGEILVTWMTSVVGTYETEATELDN